MIQFINNLFDIIKSNIIIDFDYRDVFDILIVTVLLYQLLKMTKATRASQVIKGVGILLAASVVSSWLELPIMNWLLGSVLSSGLILILILFQPELRRMMEKLGRGRLFELSLKDSLVVDNTQVVAELLKAVQNLSKRKVGALMVFTRSSTLDDIVQTGTKLDARISSMLIENIFEPNTPLHDGAMIINNGLITAAGCFLPLSENIQVDRKLGTRHRAALGLSEHTDAVILVVSEETGVISYASSGSLHRYLDLRALRELLETLYDSNGHKQMPILSSILSKNKNKTKTPKAGEQDETK